MNSVCEGKLSNQGSTKNDQGLQPLRVQENASGSDDDHTFLLGQPLSREYASAGCGAFKYAACISKSCVRSVLSLLATALYVVESRDSVRESLHGTPNLIRITLRSVVGTWKSMFRFGMLMLLLQCFIYHHGDIMLKGSWRQYHGVERTDQLDSPAKSLDFGLSVLST